MSSVWVPHVIKCIEIHSPSHFKYNLYITTRFGLQLLAVTRLCLGDS